MESVEKEDWRRGRLNRSSTRNERMTLSETIKERKDKEEEAPDC
jgi:hypothetical protein